MNSNGNISRRAGWLIILVIVFAAGLVAYFVYSAWCKTMGPMAYITRSQSGPWEAVFLTHGAWMGRTMTLIAFPDASRDVNYVVVGDVTYADSSPRFREACWTSDGTVIAVRTDMLSKVADANEDSLPFTHAFDFVEKEVIAPPKQLHEKDIKPWIERAKKIKKLVSERGGEGAAIASNETIYRMQKKVSWRKWRRWRKILKSKSGAEQKVGRMSTTCAVIN